MCCFYVAYMSLFVLLLCYLRSNFYIIFSVLMLSCYFMKNAPFQLLEHLCVFLDFLILLYYIIKSYRNQFFSIGFHLFYFFLLKIQPFSTSIGNSIKTVCPAFPGLTVSILSSVSESHKS